MPSNRPPRRRSIYSPWMASRMHLSEDAVYFGRAALAVEPFHMLLWAAAALAGVAGFRQPYAGGCSRPLCTAADIA